MANMKAAQEAKKLETELTRLFGETTYRVEKKACRGKYRGHNDYSLVFGSDRTLYIGIDSRNYIQVLHERLESIRYFRDHQAEYTEKVRAAVLENDTPFADAAVDIVPHEVCSCLAVYAVIVLSTNCGIRFVYRETMMHYALTGPGIGKYSFDVCVENMLKDIHGGMRCTQPIIEEIAS